MRDVMVILQEREDDIATARRCLAGAQFARERGDRAAWHAWMASASLARMCVVKADQLVESIVGDVTLCGRHRTETECSLSGDCIPPF